jgi:hypothetical protein
MVIVPHSPYSPDLARCDFALFPKLKIKVKGRFETVSDIQSESQAALDSTKENDFRRAYEAVDVLQSGLPGRTPQYVPKENIF